MDKETHDRFGLYLDALKSQQVVNKAVSDRIETLEQLVMKLAEKVVELSKAVK